MTDPDAIATATATDYLADIQQARQQHVADLLTRLPAEDRPAAGVWLSVHGILPPWYADRLAPERAWEPGS